MTRRTGLLATTAVSALVLGLSGGIQALAADMYTKAPPVVAPAGWWMDGYAELGGRFFIETDKGGTGGNFTTGPNDPGSRLNVTGPYGSLGKFLRYRDLSEGPFGDLFVAGGSRDGLYQYGFLGKNMGYRDQSYLLDWSKAGVYYLTLGFDQTPHVYNDNATTVFQGVGTDNLTVPAGMGPTLSGLLGPTNAGNGNNTVSAATAATIAHTIQSNLNPFNLGFDRYTGTMESRWTPTDNWDAKVDYNITRRDGTQPQGALTYNGQERGGRIVLELPKPIHDETHNANANLEYAGVTPWGGKFNVNVGYGLSLYRDDSDSFTFQNPWVVTNGTNTPVENLMSLPPSNSANMVRLYGAVDLPIKSRWIGAVNYSHGQQDSDVLPFSINPAAIAAASAANGGPPTLTGSTDFHSDNVLVNNVLTTHWTPEVQQTSRYRYYNYDASHNDTINYFLLGDSGGPGAINNFITGPITALGVNYAKQNASSDVVWRPTAYHWMTLGGGVAWEQWNRDFRGQDPGLPDVAITNEIMGKVFFNASPWDWSQLRTSYLHGQRRYDGAYVENIAGNENYANFQAYDLANRDRDQLNAYFDVFAGHGVTITPTGGLRYDNYSNWATLNATGGGLLHDNSWNAGVEASWRINPRITLMASYTREDAHKGIWIGQGAFESDVDDKIDTVTAGAKFILIPDTWDLKVAYTYVRANSSMSQNPLDTNPLQFFPNQTATLNRVDVQSKYKIDRDYLQRLGIKGETYVKLRYLWENNDVTDWQADNWDYQYLINGDTGQYKNLYLGWNNPNYNIHVLMASVGYKW